MTATDGYTPESMDAALDYIQHQHSVMRAMNGTTDATERLASTLYKSYVATQAKVVAFHRYERGFWVLMAAVGVVLLALELSLAMGVLVTLSAWWAHREGRLLGRERRHLETIRANHADWESWCAERKARADAAMLGSTDA